MVPIWVKFSNLPLKRWSKNYLSRIGSLLGVPVFADECTSKTLRLSYDRIFIEMDVIKELLREVKIADPNGNI